MALPFELLSAVTLAFCLAVFGSASLWSIAETKSARKAKPPEKPRERSFEEAVERSIWLDLVMIGTLAFEAMILLHIILVWENKLDLFDSVSLQNLIPFNFLIEPLGLLLLVFGFLFFTWSIVIRTRALPSGRLVTWGPFRFVRHPSYFSYFLMFIGLFLLWTNLLTAISFVGIPGYFGVATQEEAFLTKQFGKRYKEYQMRTGRFFPKLRLRNGR